MITALILAATFTADTSNSSANFNVTHFVISHVKGQIPIKSASLELDPGSDIPTSAKASLDPNGVDTGNQGRDGDLKSAHFFDAAADPDMSFTSSAITKVDATHFTMVGNLTMHGQTHPVTLNCEFLGRVTQRDHERVAYMAKGTLDRTQWGMTFGTTFAGSSVDIELDIEAVK